MAEDIGIEEEETPSNVVVHYNVGEGHPLYDPNGAIMFAWEELRGKRNYMLKQLDKYQGVLLYNSLTEEQQQELTTYRTALLNLPAAYDNPTDCYSNFPTKPSWMI